MERVLLTRTSHAMTLDGYFFSKNRCHVCTRGFWCPGKRTFVQELGLKNKCGLHRTTLGPGATNMSQCLCKKGAQPIAPSAYKKNIS